MDFTVLFLKDPFSSHVASRLSRFISSSWLLLDNETMKLWDYGFRVSFCMFTALLSLLDKPGPSSTIQLFRIAHEGVIFLSGMRADITKLHQVVTLLKELSYKVAKKLKKNQASE